MCSDKMVWIFVYGTLKKGGRLDRGLAKIRKDACISGATIYEDEHHWFPFGKVDMSDNKIYGELQLVSPSSIELLDRMEGYMYERVDVITDCGVPCQMYSYKGPVDYMKPIESGVFDQYADV